MEAVWINGWGLGESYVSRIADELYPEIRHTVVNPSPAWESAARVRADEAVLIGYSLGAFLILKRPELAELFGRALLLAPFADFKRESGCGGRVRAGQLRYLLKWLERDREAALSDFWDRSGIRVDSDSAPEESGETLAWGIRTLLDGAVEPSVLGDFDCWMGTVDPLLDWERSRELNPELRAVEGAGHDLRDLLEKGRISL